EHGKNVYRTCRILGYPSHPLLTQWIIEDLPQEQHNCRKGSPLVKCSHKEKEAAVLEMCCSPSSVQSIADELGVSRAALYDWKSRFLRKGDEHSMAKKRKSVDTNKSIEELTSERDELNSQVDELKQQIYRLQLEKDVLEKGAEIIKKDQGINLSLWLQAPIPFNKEEITAEEFIKRSEELLFKHEFRDVATDKEWDRIISWNNWYLDWQLNDLKKKLIRYKTYILFGNAPRSYGKNK
ncbi:MAG: transposase, partial [Butyrivibrio sp.]|nr:transposase [Butyrivibrio sp.]